MHETLSQNCSTNKDESKRIIVHETLSQNCSENKDESEQNVFNKTLSQNYYSDVDKLFSTEEYKSEYTITEQKDAGYKESSVTK